MGALLAPLLARLGAGALAIFQLEQEHQRPVVVDHLLADLLATKEVGPRAGLACAQLQIVGILPVALFDDRGEAPGELRILGPPAPHGALVDADAGRRLAERVAAARLVEIAHAQPPAALRREGALRGGTVEQGALDRLGRVLDARRTFLRLLGLALLAGLLAGLRLQLRQAHAAHMGGRVKSLAVDPLVIGRIGPAEAVDRRRLAGPKRGSERTVLIVK